MIKIRQMRQCEIPLLSNFLYEAIFIPEGVEPPPTDIVYQPELQIYVKDFGTEKDDVAFVAEVDDRIVGAAWVRIMDDYGHVDDETPSLAISVYKEFRHRGIGSALLNELLCHLKQNGYRRVSLSVQKQNFAYRIYLKAGFYVVNQTDEEYIMVCNL